MLKVTVPAAEPRTITARDGKTYFTQTVYVHTFGRDGKPNLYPEKTDFFLDRDTNGQPKVYAAGEYQLHPSSVYVDPKGRLAVAPRLAALTQR